VRVHSEACLEKRDLERSKQGGSLSERTTKGDAPRQ
jgi:hypothetical protein